LSTEADNRREASGEGDFRLFGIGPAFHARWQRTLRVCRRAQSVEEAFVEPEWSPLLTAAVDITFWPVYAWANGYHNGRVFATCPE